MKATILTFAGITLFLSMFAQSINNSETQPKGMYFIPQGSFYMKVIENKDTLKVSVSLDAFWMSNEITNSEYREYVTYIKQHPDSLMCWVELKNDRPASISERQKFIKCLKYSEILNDIIDNTKLPYTDYFTNKKYDNYPVVGVSQRQATFYCNWKTQMENQKLEKSGKPLVHDYRLPLEEEWAYVASRTSNSKNVEPADKKGILASISGNPNEWGLYNMSGNVSEWTASHQQNKWSKMDSNADNKDLKIVRGGSWKMKATADERKLLSQNTKEDYIGFRIVRSYLGNKK